MSCLYCSGEGTVFVSGPECEYTTTCSHCGGTGLQMIAVPIKRYNVLKSKAAEVEKIISSNLFWELGAGDHLNIIDSLLQHIEDI